MQEAGGAACLRPFAQLVGDTDTVPWRAQVCFLQSWHGPRRGLGRVFRGWWAWDRAGRVEPSPAAGTQTVAGACCSPVSWPLDQGATAVPSCAPSAAVPPCPIPPSLGSLAPCLPSIPEGPTALRPLLRCCPLRNPWLLTLPLSLCPGRASRLTPS